MRRVAQPLLSADSQLALEQYTQVLQHLEDLSPVTTCNYLSNLRQFIAWCECSRHDAQEGHSFIPQAVAPSLLIRYREHLQTILSLKPATILWISKGVLLSSVKDSVCALLISTI